MSAFSLPIPPGPLTRPLRRLTERSATTQRTDDRGQRTERLPPRPYQALQHLGDRLVLVAPGLPRRIVNIAEVQTIAAPQPHLVRRPHRHRQIATEVRRSLPLPGK